jgi:alkylation response protein AidB-like acyl-CoA dehydrogenase
LLRYGRLATQVQAAEELLRWAARELEEIGLAPADPDAAARGSLAVAKAKAFGSETAVHVASELFALSGASAADARHALDRHWRNARTHSIHDPVDWKYHHIAAYEVSGTLPPNHGQL